MTLPSVGLETALEFRRHGDCKGHKQSKLHKSMKSSGQVVLGALPLRGTPIVIVLTGRLNPMSSKALLLFLLHDPHQWATWNLVSKTTTAVTATNTNTTGNNFLFLWMRIIVDVRIFFKKKYILYRKDTNWKPSPTSPLGVWNNISRPHWIFVL